MNTDHDQLNILAPRAMKPKFDYLHREVQRAAGRPLTRRQALGLGGMALFAAACSTTTTTGGGGSASSRSSYSKRCRIASSPCCRTPPRTAPSRPGRGLAAG